MNYILESLFLYSAEDGCIWNKNSPEKKIILSPMANRLLQLLIEKHGNIVVREEIYHTVWRAYDLEPSGNSLNNYISLLRRAFISIGLHNEIITTVPRIGFTITKEIKKESVAEKTRKSITPALFSGMKCVIRNYPERINNLMKSIIFVLFGGVVTYYNYSHYESPKSDLHIAKQSLYGKCYFYYIQNGIKLNRATRKSIQKELIAIYGDDCSAKRYIYVHITNNVRSYDALDLTIGKCDLSALGKSENCTNTKIENWNSAL